MTIATVNQAKSKQLNLYASSRFGATLLINLVDVGLFFIYKNIYQLPGTQAGLGSTAGKITIAITSFLMGVLSDNTPSFISRYFGRRKFWIFSGSILLGTSLMHLLFPIYFIGENSSYFAWLIMWNMIFHLAYSMVIVPYQACLPELTTPEQRIPTAAKQNLANTMASSLGAVTFILATSFITDVNSPGFRTFFYIVLGYSIMQFLLFILVGFAIKKMTGSGLGLNLVKQIKTLFKDKNFMSWNLTLGIMAVGMYTLTLLVFDLLENLFFISGSRDTLIIGLILIFFTICGLVFWTKYSQRKGSKKKALRLGLLWMIVMLPLGSFSTFIISSSSYESMYLVVAIIFCMIMGFGISAYFLFPYAILADLIMVATINGDPSKSMAGTYGGFKDIFLNVFMAASGIIAGIVTDLNAYQWIGPIISIFLLVSLIPLDRTEVDPFEF